MPKIKFVAPKSIYKKLDNNVGKINTLFKQRNSKNLHTVFTSNKKLDTELNRSLEQPVKEISQLMGNYSADSGFSTLVSRIDKFLQSQKTKYGITVCIKVPNVTPHHQTIQKNVDTLDRYKQNLELLKNNQLQTIRTCIQVSTERINKESADSKKNYAILNKNLQTLHAQESDIEKRNKYFTSLTVPLARDAAKENQKFQALVIEWQNNNKDYLRYFEEYKTAYGFFVSSTITELEKIYIQQEKEFNMQLATLNNSINNIVMLCDGKEDWNNIAVLSNGLVIKAGKYSPPTFNKDFYNSQVTNTTGQNSDRLGNIQIKTENAFLSLNKTYAQICTVSDSFQLLLKSDDQSLYIQKIIVEATETQKILASQLEVQTKIIEDRKQRYTKNLNRNLALNKKYSETIEAHLADVESKNKTILQLQSTLTITKGTYNEYFNKDENDRIKIHIDYIQTWNTNYREFMKSSNDFLTTLSNYNISEIMNDMNIELEKIKSNSDKLLSPLESLIAECNKLLKSKKYEDAKTLADQLAKQTQSCKYSSTFDEKRTDQTVSEKIDKTSNSLSFLKGTAEKSYTALNVTFTNIDSLRIQKLQDSLETRTYCKSIFVFDRRASSSNENHPDNLKRKRDKNQLQSTFDIVFNNKDIIKQNTVPYFRSKAAWILVDDKGNDVTEPRLKMPYTNKNEFQKDLRALYSK